MEYQKLENLFHRISILQGVIFIGALIGGLSSSYLFDYAGTANVFVVSTMFILLAVVYSILYVDESIQDRAADRRISRLVSLELYYEHTKC